CSAPGADLRAHVSAGHYRRLRAARPPNHPRRGAGRGRLPSTSPHLEPVMPLALKFGQVRWSASWGMTLLTLSAVAAFIALGRWQWHRAADKRVLNADFSAGAAVVSDLEDRAIGDFARYAQIRVRGRYDGMHQFLLDNISHRGQAGYEVLTPLQLDDRRVLIVDRGWVPLTRSRSELPYVAIDFSAGLT